LVPMSPCCHLIHSQLLWLIEALCSFWRW
jgi:hypothetical protein